MKKKTVLKKKRIQEALAASLPMMAETKASTTTRRNMAGTIERSDRFKNIEDGLVPFNNRSYGAGGSTVDVRDAVILCQKCYYNFSLFRNIIDLMTEFSVTDIFYRGGSQKSRSFFKALFNKINLWDLEDKFFREYYRSGNVFLYRFDAKIKPADVTRITKVFGEAEDGGTVSTLPTESFTIPARYVILNPADIQIMGTASFVNGVYYKLLNDFEISRLRSPQTEEDRDVFESLPQEAKALIKKPGNASVLLPLDASKVLPVFYKKQDYEPFAVPMGYPVLEDINFKSEMKKIDMAIARTMQQMVLLVTAGTDPDKGGINKDNLKALQTLFQNQSVGRVLIADYTTKAEFVVPEIATLLDPKKYEIINQDINVGLNNVFAGSEKFANQAQKVELFIARLEQGRAAFINNFLIPEIKRIAQSLGFKNFPTPYFEDIELKDNINYVKIYARLMELGLLTPEEGLKAIETNTLPEPGTMDENQKAFKSARDKGLYQPLVGGPKEGDGAGRPGGTKAPKTTNKVSPIGASEKFSMRAITKNILAIQGLEEDVSAELRKIHKVKKLSALQKEVAHQITHVIVANEEPEKWNETISAYCKNPVDTNPSRVAEINDIAAEHNTDHFLASVLIASRV